MKINKTQLFKKAWKIARKAANKFSVSAKDFFATSLKKAWSKIKNEILIMGLCEFGNEWSKGSHHRVYFNDLTAHIDIDTLSWKEEKELRANSAHYRINEKCWYSGIKTPELWTKFKTSIEKKARSFNMTVQRKAIEIEIEKLEEEAAIFY